MDSGGPRRRSVVSDVWQGPEWWLATDKKWYPPELHPKASAARDGAADHPGADARDGSSPEAAHDRWRSRPVLSALVSGAIFIVPISLSIVAATFTAHTVPRPHTVPGLAAWWIAVLAVPSVVLFATDRLARRAMPLAMLLKMTMVFPDRAPKRLALIRQSGSTRNLARRVEEARTQGIADEPVVAAEKILALAGALNAHDRLTRGHGERVRVLTDLIAEELGLSAYDRDRLRWSALLHDIGKLTVHPDILNKPDELDDEEWEVIKTHPLEGAKLTAPLAGWLGEWANTIAEHHEKYDGTGYPYGLRGDEISFGGRIVAVADCYDTMTTVRSYKKSMSPNAARAELAACAGSQFDPRVVRAFLDISIGRLRPVAGPLAWLGSLPFVGGIPQLGQTVAALGRVGATSLVVSGAVAAGTVKSPAHASAAPTPGQGAPSSGTTVLGSTGLRTPAVGSSTTSTVAGLGSTTSTVATPGSTTSTVAGSGGAGNGGGGGTGTTTTTTVLVVTVPGTPAGVTATAGNGQARVSWSAPNDGGSPITSYTVTRYVGVVAQDRRTFTSPATSHFEKGLSNGTTYTFAVAATNAVGSSALSSPSAPVTPRAPSLNLINGGTQAGRAERGDQIVVTFSPAPSPAALCSAWGTASYPDLGGPNVVVHGTQPSAGNDTVTVSDPTDCKGGFHFGSIDMGQRGYFTGSVTFGGNIPGCTNGATTGCSTIHWDGQNTLTITLGSESSVQPTQSAPSVAVYTPAHSLGTSSTISSASRENF
jgi:putative nucleotidyltransferase with HDIG domain